jgi:hypothetical protein
MLSKVVEVLPLVAAGMLWAGAAGAAAAVGCCWQNTD